jgi:hypothetical protein
MDPAIYIETDIPPGVTLDEWRARMVRPSRTRVAGRLRDTIRAQRPMAPPRVLMRRKG